MNGIHDLIRFHEPFFLFFLIAVFIFLAILLARIFFKDKVRIILLSFFIAFFILFGRIIYSGINDLNNGQRISNSIFLSGSLIIFVLLYYLIRRAKTESMNSFRKYLRIVLFSIILYECLIAIMHLTGSKEQTKVWLEGKPLLTEWNGPKPNIYLLLFDEYQGIEGLNKLKPGIANDLTHQLREKGFFVAANPYSAFRHTFYSMSSMFAMGNLKFNTRDASLDERRIILCSSFFKTENTTVDYLVKNGYDLINHSLFDFPNVLSETQVITPIKWYTFQYLKTFPGWMVSDLLHSLPINKIQQLTNTMFWRIISYNQEVFEHTMNTISSEFAKPRLTYSHFFLPHPPVLTDSNGNIRNIKRAMNEFNANGPGFMDSYLKYVKHSNSLLLKLINKIIEKDPEAVIVFASDHGFRNWAEERADVFNIQLALRIPGKSVQGFSDTTALQNTFRIIFNNIAGQNLPLLHPPRQL